jgi:hypothetical protein
MRKLLFTLAMTFCFLGVLAQESGSSITRDLGGDTLARYRVNNLNMDGQAGFKATLGMNDSVAIVLGSDTFYINSTKPIHLWHGGQKVVIGATEFFGESADYSGILVPSETDGEWVLVSGRFDALDDFFPGQAVVIGNPAYGIIGIDTSKTVIARAEGDLFINAEEGKIQTNSQMFTANVDSLMRFEVDKKFLVIGENNDFYYFMLLEPDTTFFETASMGMNSVPIREAVAFFQATPQDIGMSWLRNYLDTPHFAGSRIVINDNEMVLGVGDSTANNLIYNTHIKLGWDTSYVRIKGETEIQGGLDVQTTSNFFYPPRMTTAQRDAASPETGAFFFNLDSLKPQYYNGTGWINIE